MDSDHHYEGVETTGGYKEDAGRLGNRLVLLGAFDKVMSDRDVR